MIINSGNLKTVTTAFSTAFDNGFGAADTMWNRVASEVPSTTGSNEYGWLGEIPEVREWVGDRIRKNLQTYDYAIKNKDWELTVKVPANSIRDDQYGMYAPVFDRMGRRAKTFPDRLVFDAMKNGFATNCYDGQYFFDTDHPVIAADGVTVNSVANTDGGAGAPWFLIDTKSALQPIILQKRQDFNFVSRDNPDDPHVFDLNEFLYGSNARFNVGYAFWQYIWGSKQALNAANFATAFTALESMKGDHGTPIGVKPDLLVCHPSLRSAASKLVNNDLGANGESNEWKGSVEVLVSPWLA